MSEKEQPQPAADPSKAIPLEPPMSETIKKGQSADDIETR